MSYRPLNADQQRYATDKGETADKVAFPDPATAPLGTDAEAGGVGATERANADAARPQLRTSFREKHRINGLVLYLIIAFVIGAAFFVVAVAAT